MLKYVIADASVLKILDKIDQLELLRRIYKEVYTTPEISSEFGKLLPKWIKIESPADIKNQKVIELHVDRGEASAIALAMEYEDILLILDDLKARKLARMLGLTITGTLGVINKAKSLELIKKIRPLIEKLKDAGFRISDDIVDAPFKEKKRMSFSLLK